MATYSAYRHIELDKVGKSKKRISNRSAGIVSVLNDSENSSISSSNSSLNDSRSSLQNGFGEHVNGVGSSPVLNGNRNGYLNGSCNGLNGHNDSRRSSTSSNTSGSARFNDTFNRLFGGDVTDSTPKKRNSSFNKDAVDRNPVTGNGVNSWEFHPSKKL